MNPTPSVPHADRDPIDEAAYESFPASDPPAFSGLHAGAPQARESPRPSARAGLSKALAALSFGLGAAELFAPRALGRWLGASERFAPLIRLYGLREIAAGVLLLRRGRRSFGARARVAGDVLDALTLAAMWRTSKRPNARGIGTALAVVGGALAIDLPAVRAIPSNSREGT